MPKKELMSVGVMTGTSGDGADFAALIVSLSSAGEVIAEQLAGTKFYGFPTNLRTRLLNAQDGKLSLIEYGRLNRDFSLWIAEKASTFLKNIQRDSIPVILGVHGQTIWHEPPARSPCFRKPGFSVQMVDAALIAQRTGIVTVSQFRQPDLALGGQGAPLVPSYHCLIAQKIASSSMGTPLPIAIHNIGGISNLTYVSNHLNELTAFDTGPGNALIDLAVAKSTKGRLRFDRNGRFARLGQVDWDFLHKLSKLDYFKKKPPKSTGREYFNKEFLRRFPMKGPNLIANVTAFTALTMADAYLKFIIGRGLKLNGVYLCGGGAKNSYLTRLFTQLLNDKQASSVLVQSIPEEVAPAAFLEAMAFGRLAVEALMGRSVSLPQVTGSRSLPVGAAIFQASNYGEILNIASLVQSNK